MKKIKSLLIYIIMSIFSFSAKVIVDNYDGSLDAVKYFINNQSYNSSMVVDNKVSKEMFDKLIENLDKNKMFLTKEDLEIYKDVKNQYGLLENNLFLYFGNHLIKTYQNKIEKEYEYAINLIKKYDFEFYNNDYIDLDREELDYAKDEKELNEIWYKRVLNDVIRLKLANETDKKIKNILIKRYTSNMKNLLKLTNEEKNQLVINSYSEIFDPHNTWFGSDAAKEFEISNSLSLVGMGAQIQQRGEGNIIFKLLKGGPAEKTKAFYPGDQFVYIGEGEKGELIDVTNYRLKDLVKLIRGKVGTVVRIGVRRDENSPVRIIKIVREKIKQEDEQISTKTINLKNKKVGYILIPGFYSKVLGKDEGRNVSEDLEDAINKFKKENVNSLVIDLRNNGGGSLSEVIEMIGYFVGKNKVAVQVKDEKGSIKKYYTHRNKIWDKPLVVMVNRNSASASEIFSGAIKDYRRGVIVGTNTWGKGSVQRVQDLIIEENEDLTYNLGMFKYTVNMFFRPNGYSTQIKGVSPDIEFLKSRYDDENGEFKYKNALKWEKIDNAINYKYNLKKSIKELTKLHKSRIVEDLKWQFLVEQNEFSNKYFDNKKAVLNINKRIKERKIKELKQKEFENKAKKLNIPIETVFVLDNGLSYNEDDIEKQRKVEEILKEYIDPETYEAANISLDLE